MGKHGRGFMRAEMYRPQRSKGRKCRNNKLLSGGALLLGKLNEMVRSRGEGATNHYEKSGTEWRRGQLRNPLETFQFNKGRPVVDTQEKRRVRRNLFGDGEKKSSVNRRLREKMRAKRKLFKSKQQHGKKPVSQSQVTDRVSSWVFSHHPEQNCTADNQSHQLPPPINDLFSVEEEYSGSSPAWMPLSPTIVPGIDAGSSEDQEPYPPSFLQLSLSTVGLPVKTEGSTPCFPYPTQNYRMDGLCSSQHPFSFNMASPLNQHQHLGSFPLDESFSSNFSFQDNKLLSCSNYNLENIASSSGNYMDSSALPWSSSMPEMDVWKNESSVRQVMPRVMWGEDGFGQWQ